MGKAPPFKRNVIRIRDDSFYDWTVDASATVPDAAQPSQQTGEEK